MVNYGLVRSLPMQKHAAGHLLGTESFLSCADMEYPTQTLVVMVGSVGELMPKPQGCKVFDIK